MQKKRKRESRTYFPIASIRSRTSSSNSGSLLPG